MNALNEVNKVISSVSYYTHRHGNPEEEEWLTAERMAVSHASVLNDWTGEGYEPCQENDLVIIIEYTEQTKFVIKIYKGL